MGALGAIVGLDTDIASITVFLKRIVHLT